MAGLRQDRVRSTVLGEGWDPLLFLKDQAKGGVTLVTSRGVKPISAGLLIDRGTRNTDQPAMAPTSGRQNWNQGPVFIPAGENE